MDLDVVLLSRIQFAFTIMFHYLYPPLSIGLGLILVFMEGMYLKTKNPMYEAMTKFWVKIFALTFGIGVATGLVMEFEFGTNWATYSRFVGDVFGSALAAEGIFAFFLESGFLAILVFGWDKVSPRVHFLSTVLVCLGSIFSAIWIVVALSWQQTPAGFHLVGRDAAGQLIEVVQPMVYNFGMYEELQVRAEITSFWQMVFNPSSMIRLGHVLLGSFIQGSFLVLSICAYYILRNRHVDFARRSFIIALVLAAASSLLQVGAGHLSAEVVAEHQPAKLAAMEGHYETGPGDLHLFGWPNDEEGRVDFGLAIPKMLSFLVHFDFNEPVIGLNDIPEDERPPVQIPFQTYHMMVALGFYFLGLTFYSLFLLKKGTLFETRWLMWVFVFSVIFPFIANQAGWVAAEVGRQPWIVYGILKTSDGVSKSVSAQAVMGSLIMFTLIYLLLLVLFLYILDRKIKHGPDIPAHVEEEMPEHTSGKDWLDAAARRGKTSHGMFEEGESE